MALSVADNWKLIPFADIGLATETELDQTVTVWGVGLRSRASFADDRREYVLWNELIGAGSSATELTRASSFVVFDTDFEIRGLVDFRLGRHELELGLLARSELYPGSGQIAAPPVKRTRSDNDGSSASRSGRGAAMRLFGREIGAPRLGLAYRFGQSVSGFHLLLRWKK